MDPITMATYISAGELHNDVYVIGPYRTGNGTAVRIFLKNGYGISLGTSHYEPDTMPMVAPIRRNEDGTENFTYAWEAHPDFAEIKFSERSCDRARAIEILTHLKGK